MTNKISSIGVYTMAFVGIVDQLSKWAVLDKLGDVHNTIVLTPFLNIVLVWNKGITFGMLSSSSSTYTPYILTSLAVIIMFMLGRWLLRTESYAAALALGAVMGGATGNIIDRLRYGKVVDFIDFHYNNYHWYAFNVADAAIVMGVTLLMLDGMVRGK